jgi:hypothetical protein
VCRAPVAERPDWLSAGPTLLRVVVLPVPSPLAVRLRAGFVDPWAIGVFVPARGYIRTRGDVSRFAPHLPGARNARDHTRRSTTEYVGTLPVAPSEEPNSVSRTQFSPNTRLLANLCRRRQ